MSGFTIEIKPEDTSATVIKNVKRNLDDAEATAKKATQAISGMSAAINRLDSLAAATKGYREELAEVVKNATRARSATENLEAALRAEASIIERLRGPMDTLQADTAALERLQKRGALTAREYQQELERLQAQGSKQWEGTSLADPANSVKTKKPDSVTASDKSWGEVGDVGGAIEKAAPGIAKMLPMIGAIVGVAIAAAAAIIALGDSYTELSNSAEKIAHENELVIEVIDRTYDASVKLHAGLHDTLELMDAVRDGTDELNMTSREQENLALGVGAAIRLEGKSLSEAQGLMSSLSFAMAEGSITGRELKGILKEYPDIAAAMTESTGKSRAELLKMAADGKVTGEMLQEHFANSGALLDKLGERAETTGEKMQHFKDKVTVAWGGVAQSVSQKLGTLLDGLTSQLDVLEDYRRSIELQVHAQTFQAEIENKMIGVRERAVDIMRVQNDMAKQGLDTGPMKFDAETFTSYERLRSTMQEVFAVMNVTGVTMKAVYTEANSKVVQYQKGVQDLADSKAAEKHTEEIRKMWKEWAHANDFIDDYNKSVQTAADKIEDLTKAEGILANQRVQIAQAMIAKGDRISGASYGTNLTAQEVKLQREKADALTDQAVLLGTISKQSGDAIKSLRDHKTAIADVRADYTAGKITLAEYTEALKSAGVEESRMEKMFHDIRDPAKNFGLDIKALDALFKGGTITLSEYERHLNKIMDAYAGKDIRDLLDSMGAPKAKPQVSVSNEGVAPGSFITENPDLGIDASINVLQERYKMLEAYDDKVTAKMAELETAVVKPDAPDLAKDLEVKERICEVTRKNTNATKAWNDEIRRLRANADQTGAQLKNGFNEIKQHIIEGADAGKVMVTAFDGISNAISDMVVKGKADWASLEQTILAAMTKMLLMKGLMMAFGITPPPSAGSGGLPGFATGGSFIVGGSGGTDTTPVAFKATPGERVTITPPTGPSSKGGGAAPRMGATKVVNVGDHKQAALEAMNTRDGEQLIMNTVYKNIGNIAGHITKRK